MAFTLGLTKEFLNYIKTIAGNPNYEFPREYIQNTNQ